VGLQRAIDLAHHGRCQAVVADVDHRVEVVGVGAMELALGGGQGDRGHLRIIRPR
jgi:hypothetical protein